MMIRPKSVTEQEIQMSEEMKIAQTKAIAAYGAFQNGKISAEIANVDIDTFNAFCDSTGLTSLKRVRM